MKNNIICAYYFDKGNYSFDEYRPNCLKLNKVIKKWAKDGIEFVGIIHSHQNGYAKPSLQDGVYMKQMMHENKFLKKMITPILTRDEKGSKIVFYEYVTDFLQIDVLSIP